MGTGAGIRGYIAGRQERREQVWDWGASCAGGGKGGAACGGAACGEGIHQLRMKHLNDPSQALAGHLFCTCDSLDALNTGRRLCLWHIVAARHCTPYLPPGPRMLELFNWVSVGALIIFGSLVARDQDLVPSISIPTVSCAAAGPAPPIEINSSMSGVRASPCE